MTAGIDGAATAAAGPDSGSGAPGGVLVVAGTRFEQDADQPVADLAQRSAVRLAAGAQLVVVELIAKGNRCGVGATRQVVGGRRPGR